MKEDDDYRTIPEGILKVALQPTARGGPNHFIAGNIRIVSAARQLLEAEERQNVEDNRWMIAHRMEVDDDMWTAWFEESFHLDEGARGDLNEEQLLIEDQDMYHCPLCGSNSLL